MAVHAQRPHERFRESSAEKKVEQHEHSRWLSINFRWNARVAAAYITNVDVFFGSLNGTAEQFAARVATSIATRGISAVLRSLDTFDPTEFTSPERLVNTRAVVFVVSTRFAEAPPNAERFHQWLHIVSDRVGPVANRRALMAEMEADIAASSSDISFNVTGSRLTKASHAVLALKGLQYAVFGVGDSKYLTYNAAAKFIDVRLHSIGATRLLGLGLADVSNDAEGAFVKWEQSLWKMLPQIRRDTERRASSSIRLAPGVRIDNKPHIEASEADQSAKISPLSRPRPNSSSSQRVIAVVPKRTASSCPNVYLLGQVDEL